MTREDLVKRMGEAAAIAAGEVAKQEQATVAELVSAYVSLFASATCPGCRTSHWNGPCGTCWLS